MARLPRLVIAGQPHLVIQRALPGRPAFVDAVDREAFLAALREGLAAEGVQLHAFALLPQEFRLLVTPNEAPALGRLMQVIGRRYVSAHHRRHGGAGSLWAGRFRCAPVERGSSCLDAMLAVDLAGGDGASTSAAHHAGAARGGPLVDPPEYWALGNTPFERETAYRARLATGLTPERTSALLAAAQGGWAIGSATFVAALGARAGRPPAPRRRGRPRRGAAPGDKPR